MNNTMERLNREIWRRSRVVCKLADFYEVFLEGLFLYIENMDIIECEDVQIYCEEKCRLLGVSLFSSCRNRWLRQLESRLAGVMALLSLY